MYESFRYGKASDASGTVATSLTAEGRRAQLNRVASGRMRYDSGADSSQGRMDRSASGQGAGVVARPLSVFGGSAARVQFIYGSRISYLGSVNMGP